MDLLYGRNAVLEALRAGRPIRRLLVAESAHGLELHIAEARRRRVQVEAVGRHDLARRVGDHHQGVVAEAEPFPYSRLDDILAAADQRGESALVLVLDSIQDPQNFGTLLRTAQACGVHGVVIPERRAVGITPSVSNASAGAVEHLRVARVTNLSRALRSLKDAGVWTYGLAADAERSFATTDFSGPVGVVVGSEGEGLSRLVRDTCDVLVRIPMVPQAIESLNAAVAGSLVVYEAFRQRQGQNGQSNRFN